MVCTLRFFPLQNSVCFINLTYLVPVLFTFYIQVVLKLKKNNSGTKRLSSSRRVVVVCCLHLYCLYILPQWYKLNETHKLSVYAKLLIYEGDNVNAIKRTWENLDASKDVCIQRQTQGKLSIYSCLMCRIGGEMTRRRHSNKSLENMAKFKYLEFTPINVAHCSYAATTFINMA